MTDRTEQALLAEADGPALHTDNPHGNGLFLIICDHASNRIPSALGTLGLSEEAIQSHAAWDPGAYGLAEKLVSYLDAPLISAGFSRLVYDVNRPPESPQAIRASSEIYDVPGNQHLSEEAREARIKAIYEPYHANIAERIEARTGRGQTTVLISLHSFTRIYHGQERQVQLGILHDADTRLADALLECAPRFTELKIARNEPYGPEDGVTHTLAKHAIPRGLLNVMIEFRNDLITSEEDQCVIAEILAKMLITALEMIVSENVRSTQPGGDDAPSD